MTPVFLREADDCFRACLASLADKPLHHVPHFFKGLRNGEPIDADRQECIRQWFASLGLCLIRFPLPVPDLTMALEVMHMSHPGPHYILTGRTINGLDHAVIARDGAVVHDPALPGLGLFAGHEHGTFGICMIGVLV